MREYFCVERGLIAPETDKSAKAEGRHFIQLLEKGLGARLPAPHCCRGWK